MKAKFNISVFFILIAVISHPSSSSGQAGVVTANIKVYGNCKMCKKRIETALDHKGIKQAAWDPRTKNLTVVYNSAKISEQQIHEIVAAAGHDTDKVKARDEIYATLPFCCLYREGETSGEHKDHQ